MPEADLPLVRDLPLADVVPETGVIDFAFNPSYRFLEDGWWKPQTDKENVHYCWVRGNRATVRPFFVNPGPMVCEIDFWPLIYPQAIQLGVQLRINGRILGERKIPRKAQYQPFRWDLPEGTLEPGWNDMELVFDDAWIPDRVQSFSNIQVPYSARVSRIAFFPKEEKNSDGLQSPEGIETIVQADELLNNAGHWNTIRVKMPSRISFHYVLPDNAQLQFQRNGALYPGHYRVGIRRVESREEILLDERLDADGSRWESSLLHLGQGGPVELFLESETGGVVWLEPGLLTGGRPVENDWVTAPVSEIIEQPGRSHQAVWREQLPKLILIYMVDTLRADHLGVYGYEKNTSPYLDDFAKDALIYDQAYSTSSWTKSAIASLFTGLYPTGIGMTRREDRLPEGIRTMAEYLRGRGYQTFGVTTNSYISATFDMVRGFEQFRHLLERPESRNVNVPSDEMLAEFENHLESFDPDRPLFVYLHSTDPHGPYELGRDIYPDWSHPERERNCDTKQIITDIYDATWASDEQQRRQFVDYYDAEIYFNDRTFGRLLGLLKSHGWYDDSLIIFTSDHGEEFFDHGWIEHGKTLYEEVLRIPLLIKWPGRAGLRGRIATNVSLVDILPSLLWWIEGRADVSLHGIPLVVRDEPEERPRVLFAETSIDRVEKRALLVDRDKVIWSPLALRALKEPGPWVEWYNLEEDPGEQRNLASDRPVKTGLRRQAVRTWEAVFDSDALFFREGQELQEIDKETLERLEAMGYVGR